MPGVRYPAIVGFAVAPAAAPVVAGVVAAAFMLTKNEPDLLKTALVFGAWVGGVGLLVSYAIALVLGVPAFWLMTRCGWRTLPHFMGAAAVTGGIPPLPFGAFGTALVGMILGAVNGATFWLIVRPDGATPRGEIAP